MTDNEIIKAWEWCEQFENNVVMCGRHGEKYTYTLQMMQIIKQALKDYNRQKAEIERLEKANESFSCMGKFYSEIKSEAIKEFAERLTDRICENVNRSLDNPNGNNYYPIDVYKDIDNLVKETTEGKNDFKNLGKSREQKPIK